MRRILPVLVSLVAFYVPQSFAVTAKWSKSMPACTRIAAGSALAETCPITKSNICGAGSGSDCDFNIETKNPEPLHACAELVEDARQACPSTSIVKFESGMSGGLKERCEKYKQSVDAGKDGNRNYAVTCRTAIAKCRGGCMALRGSGSSASGSSASSVPLPGARPTSFGSSADWDAAQRMCENLESANAIEAEKQMAGLATDSSLAEQCKKLADADPSNPTKPGAGGGDPSSPGGGQQKPGNSAGSGMGGMNPMQMMSMMQQLMKKDDQQEQDQEIPAMQDCTANPALAGCASAATVPQSWNAATNGQDGSKSDDSGGSFNPADTSGMQPSSVDPAQQAMGTPMTNSAIPNGGGGMPGGGGGGAASLGSSGGGGGGAQGPGKKVEVQTGGGGGYSSQNAGMNMRNGEGGGGYSYGSGRNSGAGEDNLDLASFLPGGSRAPASLKLGANTTGNFQIQSKDVNLFSRISERIKSRCAQGLLRDCIP